LSDDFTAKVRGRYSYSVKEGIQKWGFPVLLLAISLICASTIQILIPGLKHVAIDDGMRRLEDVPFPFIRQTSQPVTEYRVTAEIDRRSYQFTKLVLLPTLCLTSANVNGQPLTFNAPSSSGHCDYINGYTISLPTGTAAAPGHLLHLEAKVSTNFYVFGLSVRPPPGNPVVLALKLMGIATLTAGLYLALRRSHFSRPVSLILLGALPVQLLYLLHTPVVERTYDILGHLQYVEYIADHFSLPPSDFCYECYQPSLYYLAAAPIYSMARAMRFFDSEVVLQFFSLACFWVFIVMSARICLLWLPKKREAELAIALIAFWPGGFLHSARVSNDIALYALFATCLYFVLRWWETGSRRALFIAASVAGCGVLIKATMIVLIGAIGILILSRILRDRCKGTPGSSYVQPILPMVAGVAAYVALSFFRAGALPATWHDWRSIYAGNNWMYLDPSTYVGNSWRQYLLLDTASYFKLPFVDSARAGTGREYFWNYVLKSSMFGDFDWFHKPVERVLALIMAPLLLALVGLFWVGVVRSLRRPNLHSLPLLVAVFLSFLSLFAHRFYLPYSADNDFRFIYPALIPIVLLMVEGTRNIRGAGTLCCLFCGLSAAFYLSV
jgi:hypothetical protein